MKPLAWVCCCSAIALWACNSGPDNRNGSTADTVLTAARTAPDSTTPHDSTRPAVVHTEMQNVDMQIEPGIVLRIARLRGTVLPAKPGTTPALNDKASMIIGIASADIVVDTNSLATLLNRHVFGYKGSPLSKLHVSLFGNEMIQTGVVHKGVDLSFRIRATVSLTKNGEIRLHPTRVSVAGVGAKGITDKLGGLSKLISLEPGHGARIEHDDFILNVEQMLPPPHIRGKLSSISIVKNGIRQTFGPTNDSASKPTRRPGSDAKNYMYFHGGTLSFGKLTMKDTDLEIVDEDESNPFDYDLDRYQEHLVQGRSASTMADGLIVHMPDIAQLAPRRSVKPRARGR
jgi:hypothetical protein